jgi:hypothetical protein
MVAIACDIDISFCCDEYDEDAHGYAQAEAAGTHEYAMGLEGKERRKSGE